MIFSIFIAVMALMHFFFLLAVWKKNFGLVDIAWGQGFIIIALVSYFYHFNSVKNAFVLFLVLCWGLRLSLYLLTRNWKAPEDQRYKDMREEWGAHPNVHAYFKVFILQGLLMLLISLPITAGMSRAVQELSWINKIGVVIFFFAWLFESYSDRYLKKYKADPANKGTICMSGPWKLCRFPNYFGEITLWYGIYLASFHPSIWWTIIGPLTINFFILKVSGVPLLEKKYLKRPEYLEYAARVPRLIPFTLMFVLISCAPKYDKTVDHVDRDKFMGKWYVMAGRFTALESDVFNSIEKYTWNEEEKRIDIDFRFNKGGFDGPLKEYPQKAWIASENNARWKVQPFWPLKFDYLVIGLSPDYRWTAIGVPNQKYLWIMSKDPMFSREEISKALKEIKSLGYDTSEIKYVQHKY